MGAQIAAHFANAGVPALLLDLDADVARDGPRAGAHASSQTRSSPADTPLADRTGGFDTDLARDRRAPTGSSRPSSSSSTSSAALLERVDAVRRPGTIVTLEHVGHPDRRSSPRGGPADFRRHWLGTHFFNPPRYLQLLEIIPTADTDPAVVELSRGSPTIGSARASSSRRTRRTSSPTTSALYGVMRAARGARVGRYTIEEIDAITGPALGRPKSATFRTMDIAGLDVLAHVVPQPARPAARGDGAGRVRVPPLLDTLLARGWLGEKAGQGFYKRRERGADGESEILTLDPATLDYRPQRAGAAAALDAARSIDGRRRARSGRCSSAQDTRRRISARDARADARSTRRASRRTSRTRSTTSIACMRWGFGWELGPFETHGRDRRRAGRRGWRQSGSRETAAAAARGTRWLAARIQGCAPTPPAAPGLQILRDARDRSAVVKRNAGASLVDLGDGVLAVEFHSKMNAIGGDTLADAAARAWRRPSGTSPRSSSATTRANFSAGANLMLLLLEAQEGNWDEIDLMVRTFQARHHGAAYADGAGGRGAGRADARRRLRDRAARATACRRRPRATSVWSRSASA